jgi:hypothetical protein
MHRKANDESVLVTGCWLLVTGYYLSRGKIETFNSRKILMLSYVDTIKQGHIQEKLS